MVSAPLVARGSAGWQLRRSQPPNRKARLVAPGSRGGLLTRRPPRACRQSTAEAVLVPEAQAPMAAAARHHGRAA